MADNESILGGLLNFSGYKYATPEQRRRAQQHAYSMMEQPNEKYLSWSQPVRDVLNGLVGRSILNQTNEQEAQQLNQGGQSQANLLDEIQRRAKQQTPQASAAPTPPITTGSLPPEAAGGIAGAGLPEGSMGATGNPVENPKTGYKLDEYLKRLFEIESGNNPEAKKGSYRGLAQFSPDLEKKYGINEDNWKDPTTQIRAAAQHTVESAKAYQDRFGHVPTNGELYLMHQQGVNGGTSILGGEPNAPAWKTIKEAAKISDDEAKRRITGNIPTGSALLKKPVDQITNQEFGRLWTGKFDSEQSNYKPMMLGGPKESETATPGPQGHQVAQANGIPPAVAAPSAAVDKDNLARFLSSSTIPQPTKDQIQKMMIEGATPAARETAQGIQQFRPSNPEETSQPGAVQANRAISLHGLSIPMTEYTNPNGSRTPMFAIPGHGLTDAEGLMKWSNEQQAKTAQHVGTSTESTKRYEDTFGGIQELADKSQEQIPRIQKMRELIKDPRFYSGVGDNRVLDASKVLHALGVSPGSSTPTEVFKKLAAGETLNELKQFNGYGRVLATEFDQLKQSLANTNMSEPAIDDLLKMSEKLHGRAVRIGDEASKYAMETEHKGLDKGWDIYLRNWKRNNPSLSKEDIKEPASRQLKQQPKDEIPKFEKIPEGRHLGRQFREVQ